jgi:hypothetical protein
MGGMICFSMVVIDDSYEGWSVPAIRQVYLGANDLLVQGSQVEQAHRSNPG